MHVQPAEMAKVALVIWLAYSLAKKAERVKTFTVGFLPHLIVAGVFMLLCLKQPDFGSAVVLLLLTFTMLFVAGAKVGYILGASILGGAFGAAAIRFREYRYERYLAWLHMDQHRQDLAYQPFQSVMSFGSGGPSGLGHRARPADALPARGAHRLRRRHRRRGARLPRRRGALRARTCCLVARGVRAALRAPDDFGSFLAFGLSTMFGVQALVNLAVALAILPTKGLTLAVRQLRRLVAARERRRRRASCSTSRASPASRPRSDAAAPEAGPPSRADGSIDPTPSSTASAVSRARTVLIAGGGTGGHVFPARRRGRGAAGARRRRRRLLRDAARRRGARRARRAAGGSSCSTSSR